VCKKQDVIAGLLILIVVSFAITGCGKRLNIGELQTKSQTVELGDADAVTVAIQMGAGELDVSGGASELLQVKDSGVEGGIASLLDLDEFHNEWDLKLNEDVPMQMAIDLGAGRSNLVLGALHLTSLNINGGAGEVTIDLTGDWQDDLDAQIAGGLGNLNLRLPSGAGARIAVETGVGSVEASGLARDGDTYTNEVYGTSDVTLSIDIEGGVGQINLDVE
jgi:hypothetical protein